MVAIDTVPSSPDNAERSWWWRFGLVGRALARTSVTAAVYTGIMVIAEIALNTRSPRVRSAWLAWASTSLANLHAHPIRSLVASAFLPDGDLAGWLALALIGLVAAGQALGNRRLAVLVAVSHVAATLFSQGLLAVRLNAGVPGAAADALVLDVGSSYVVVPALVVGIGYGSWPARVLSALAFAALSPHLFGGLTHLNVSAVGHCCAIVIGLGLGYPLWRSRGPRA